MARSQKTPRRKTRADLIDSQDRCPCLSGNTLATCCGPVLSGERKASTAEQLMRSRYTAFATGDTAYLLKSWHPDTRPETLDPDPDAQWYRLDILWTQGGGLLDSEGQVSFRAYYRHPDGPGVLEEVSRFVRDKGEWFYAVAM